MTYFTQNINSILTKVRTCEIYQQTATLPPQRQKKLHSIPPTDRPLLHIGMDLICDLPITINDYRYILVTVLPLQIRHCSGTNENIRRGYTEIRRLIP